MNVTDEDYDELMKKLAELISSGYIEGDTKVAAEHLIQSWSDGLVTIKGKRQ